MNTSPTATSHGEGTLELHSRVCASLGMWNSTPCLTALCGQDAWRGAVGLKGITGFAAHSSCGTGSVAMTGHLVSPTDHKMEN